MTEVPSTLVASTESFDIPIRSEATTISAPLGGGFYAHWGPVACVIGFVLPRRYAIVQLTTAVRPYAGN
jgi:hypothetical protein